MLDAVHMRCRWMRQLKLHGVYLDTDKKLALMTEFIAKTQLTKIKLSLNMLNNLDILSRVSENKNLHTLTL